MICGLYELSGKPVDVEGVLHMLESCQYLGDTSRTFQSATSVAMGFRQIGRRGNTVPARKGNLLIVTDLRLDCQAELASKLGYPLSKAVSDEELVLASYERWGNHCVHHLVGDFAFVIWDADRQRMFCARDRFGIRPFYYFYTSQTFGFASSVKALLTTTVDRELDENRIADFLAGIDVDWDSTFYRNIRRLAPGHFLVVSRKRQSLQRYYTLQSREVSKSTDVESAARLRTLLEEAVLSRLRGSRHAVCTLSGGLDSSSIACIAARSQEASLFSFSNRYPHLPECDEGSYIKAVVAATGAAAYFHDTSHLDPFSCLPAMLEEFAEPFLAPNLFVSWSLYKEIQKNGFEAVLDGHGGDETVSHGYGRLKELAMAYRLMSLAWELMLLPSDGESKIGGWWRLVKRYSLSPLRTALFSSLKPMIGVKTANECVSGPEPRRASLVCEELARRVSLNDRRAESFRNHPASGENENAMHLKILSGPRQALQFELNYSLGAAFGLELLYPFWDQRLVEFCTRLPADQKLRHGLTRAVLRRAMKGILPEQIRLRRRKTDFTRNFVRGIVSGIAVIAEMVARPPAGVGHFVDLDYVESLFSELTSKREKVPLATALILYRYMLFAHWLTLQNSLSVEGWDEFPRKEGLTEGKLEQICRQQ